MIRELILPQLAMGMSEGTIVEWAVAEGGFVERDQTLVSIETEKVVTDLPAPYPQRACSTRCVRKAKHCFREDGVVARQEERDELEAIRRAVAAGQIPE